MEIFKASRQWAERPQDERFWNIKELHEAVTGYRKTAREQKVPYKDIETVPNGVEVMLRHRRTGNLAGLSHWAFGQLCQRAQAPAAYLRGIPSDLAVSCLNHGLSLRADDEVANLMFHQNGNLLTRAITSQVYSRIWNADVTPFLLDMGESGWITPPARPSVEDPRTRHATLEDVAAMGNAGHPSLSIQVGDLIAPAGVYASDHDMFVFMIDPTRRIEDGSEGGLYRGMIVGNSEVGAASLWAMRFMFRHVCGNHIIWDASDAYTVRIRHVGEGAFDRFRSEFRAVVEQFANSSASEDEALIKRAQAFRLGDDKVKVLEFLFGKRLPVTKTAIEQAYDLGIEYEETDGSPQFAYGMVNALTRVSQKTAYADERTSIDKAASKLLQLAA
jgi:hypothetical protein